MTKNALSAVKIMKEEWINLFVELYKKIDKIKTIRLITL